MFLVLGGLTFRRGSGIATWGLTYPYLAMSSDGSELPTVFATQHVGLQRYLYILLVSIPAAQRGKVYLRFSVKNEQKHENTTKREGMKRSKQWC